MQNKKPLNDKGLAYGLWEVYHHNGKLWLKGTYLNGKRHGFFEEYYHNGKTYYKGSYLNGKYIGFWIFYYYSSSIKQIRFYAR